MSLDLHSILTDPMHYRYLADRAARLMADPHFEKKLDPGIAPLIQRLNLIEGVATVFSCTGHPEQVLVDKRYADAFYVMLALRDSYALEHVIDTLYLPIKEFYFKDCPEETVAHSQLMHLRTSLRMSFVQRMIPEDHPDDRRWYNATVVSGKIPVYRNKCDDFHGREITTVFRDHLFSHLA